jgi:hypothetical protein
VEFIPCDPDEALPDEALPDAALPDAALPVAPVPVDPALLLIALSPFIPVELHAASVNAITPPSTRLEIVVFIITPVSLICAHDLSIYCGHL